MRFLISKELTQGNYIVRVALSEFSENDQKKAIKFGMPRLKVILQNGNAMASPINVLQNLPPFSFTNQNDADNYEINLKTQINQIKESWLTLEDKWSKQEEI